VNAYAKSVWQVGPRNLASPSPVTPNLAQSQLDAFDSQQSELEICSTQKLFLKKV
jgi:hypothetical protein